MLAPPVPLFYDPVRGEGFPSTCPREFFGFPIFLVGHEQFQWLKALDSTLRGKTRAIPYLSELDRILVLLWLSSKLVNSAPILPWSKRTSPALREPSQCYSVSQLNCIQSQYFTPWERTNSRLTQIPFLPKRFHFRQNIWQKPVDTPLSGDYDWSVTLPPQNVC